MLQKSMIYRTKQSELILSCLKKNSDRHLTIEEISDQLKADNNPVGTATIYRNVEKLVSDGLVRKYSTDSTKGACFQFISSHGCKNHFHLKCTKCGKLFHASCPVLDSIGEHILSHHGFEVDNTRTVFYGICKTCKNTESKEL